MIKKAIDHAMFPHPHNAGPEMHDAPPAGLFIFASP
jgi:hypothetical protein